MIINSDQQQDSSASVFNAVVESEASHWSVASSGLESDPILGFYLSRSHELRQTVGI